MLLAIDPGADQGWALFDEKVLVRCGVGDFRPVIEPDFQKVAGAVLLVSVLECVVCECPTLYRGGKARPADVITLALRAGEAVGFAKGMWPNAKCEYVEPRTWKGQVPKDVHHARIFAALNDIERNVVATNLKGLAASKRHNALDAVGLGLWAAKRRV